jgi:hypothetical protein
MEAFCVFSFFEALWLLYFSQTITETSSESLPLGGSPHPMEPHIICMNVKMNMHVEEEEGLWLPFEKPFIGENY